jgi:hypothetical protein
LYGISRIADMPCRQRETKTDDFIRHIPSHLASLSNLIVAQYIL